MYLQDPNEADDTKDDPKEVEEGNSEAEANEDIPPRDVANSSTAKSFVQNTAATAPGIPGSPGSHGTSSSSSSSSTRCHRTGGGGRHFKNRKEAIERILPRVVKYIQRRYVDVIESDIESEKLEAIRSALSKIEEVLPRKVFWNGPTYATKYTASTAIVSIYWDRVVEGVRERISKSC